jgi:hypothetical protein
VPAYNKGDFMTGTLVDQTYKIALVVAFCAAFMLAMIVTPLLDPIFEGVSPAAEILWGSGGFGELPPVW